MHLSFQWGQKLYSAWVFIYASWVLITVQPLVKTLLPFSFKKTNSVFYGHQNTETCSFAIKMAQSQVYNGARLPLTEAQMAGKCFWFWSGYLAKYYFGHAHKPFVPHWFLHSCESHIMQSTLWWWASMYCRDWFGDVSVPAHRLLPSKFITSHCQWRLLCLPLSSL